MFKILAFLLLVAASSAAPKPGAVGHLHAAPVVAAPYVAPATVVARSSQVFARNYNALAAPLVAAAPAVVAAPAVASAPYLASPYLSSPYLASPYLASPYYSQPLIY